MYPPPHRGTSNRQLTIPALLFAAAASGALLLGACDSPTGENPNTNGGKVTPTSYTTTVTGRVTDKSTAAGVPDAEVSASTAPGTVVKTRSDGSFTFQVKEHTGTFTLTVKKAGYTPVTTERIDTTENTRTVPVIQLTKITPTGGGTPEPATSATYTTTVTGKVITADYTAADGKYTTSTAQTVNTTGAAIDNQDIALKYGYTTTVSGTVVTIPPGGGTTTPVVGATVVIEVEGIEAGRDTTEGVNGEYNITTVDHPGVMIAIVTSLTGNVTRNLTTTDTELIRIFNL